MAWESKTISINGEEVKVAINGNIIELPFTEGLGTDSVISIDSKEVKVLNIKDIGERQETLQIEVDNDKQVQRRTKGKTKQD
tara:strand:- start:287 stop:532 length:246 start_codon:yes stop_codon:yes gene_type:complete